MFGSFVAKLTGKRSPTPVELGRAVAFEVTDLIRRTTLSLQDSKGIIPDEQRARLYFEFAAAHVSIFTATFFGTCRNEEFARETYVVYGGGIALWISENRSFDLDYDDLSARFKARGEEYLPILRRSAGKDYRSFAAAFCINTGQPIENSPEQLLWIESSGAHYHAFLERLWERIGPW